MLNIEDISDNKMGADISLCKCHHSLIYLFVYYFINLFNVTWSIDSWKSVIVLDMEAMHIFTQ